MSLSLHTDTPRAGTLPGAAPGEAASGDTAGRGIRSRLLAQYIALAAAKIGRFAKAIERGAVGLLTKPIDFALLRQEIDTRLEQAA